MRPLVPLILLASADDISAHSLESAMTAAGYGVLRASNGWSALEQHRRSHPHAVVIAAELDDGGGLELCRKLQHHEDPADNAPVFITQTTPATRAQRLEALRAGADQLWGHPVDVDEFVLRLAAQLRAKFAADEAREDSLVETRTSLWNTRGLLRRAEEVVAAAARDQQPVAVAIVDLQGVQQSADWDLGDRLAACIRRSARSSDTVARLGAARCAILAPRTGTEACHKMGERLLAQIGPTIGAASSWLRVGYAAYDGTKSGPAAQLVERAEVAAREGAAPSTDARLRCWRS
jgi:PleD family two-component response regulator